MPPAMLKPCSRIGCPNLTAERYCPEHAKLRHGVRKSTTDRGYGHDWRRVRDAVIASEPLCRHCAAKGLSVLATQVDHIQPIERAPHLRLVRSNLQSLCTTCHNRKTNGETGIDA